MLWNIVTIEINEFRKQRGRNPIPNSGSRTRGCKARGVVKFVQKKIRRKSKKKAKNKKGMFVSFNQSILTELFPQNMILLFYMYPYIYVTPARGGKAAGVGKRVLIRL